MNKILSIMMLVGMGCVGQASAQNTVYTWVDQSGVRHYSDQPVAPRNAVQKNIRVSGASSTPVTPPRRPASTQSTDELTKNWEEGARPDEKLAPTRAAACEVAQRNLQVLADGSRPAYKRGSDGQPVAIEGDERSAEMQRAQGDVDAYCQ